MTLQNILGIAALIIGAIYLVIMLYSIFKDKNSFNSYPGRLPVFMISEFVIYFLATMGISDFLLNTITLDKLKATEIKHMPDNLISCCIVPGAIMAYIYLKPEGSVDILTLVAFMVCIMIGSSVGSMIVGKLDGEIVRKAMGICLILSMIFVVAKLILSNGASSDAIGLHGLKFSILCTCSLLMGFINMLGVPMKPTATAVLLLLGLSPLTTLTMVIAMGCVAPFCGGIRVVKAEKYNKKVLLSAIVAGSVAAIIGTSFAVTLDATLLSIILLVMMAIAAISLLKKPKM